MAVLRALCKEALFLRKEFDLTKARANSKSIKINFDFQERMWFKYPCILLLLLIIIMIHSSLRCHCLLCGNHLTYYIPYDIAFKFYFIKQHPHLGGLLYEQSPCMVVVVGVYLISHSPRGMEGGAIWSASSHGVGVGIAIGSSNVLKTNIEVEVEIFYKMFCFKTKMCKFCL